MLVRASLFHPSLIFVSKARAHQSGAQIMSIVTLVLTNIRLGYKVIEVTNALAYEVVLFITTCNKILLHRPLVESILNRLNYFEYRPKL